MQRLTTDILCSVFKYLDVIKIWKIREVCKYWKACIEANGPRIFPEHVDIDKVSMIPYIGALDGVKSVRCHPGVYEVLTNHNKSITKINVCGRDDYRIYLDIGKSSREIIATGLRFVAGEHIKKLYCTALSVAPCPEIIELGLPIRQWNAHSDRFPNLKILHLYHDGGTRRISHMPASLDILVIESAGVTMSSRIADPDYLVKCLRIVGGKLAPGTFNSILPHITESIELYDIDPSDSTSDEDIPSEESLAEQHGLKYTIMTTNYPIRFNDKHKFTVSQAIVNTLICSFDNPFICNGVHEEDKCFVCFIVSTSPIGAISGLESKAIYDELKQLKVYGILTEKIDEIIGKVDSYSARHRAGIYMRLTRFKSIKRARLLSQSCIHHINKLGIASKAAPPLLDGQVEDHLLISGILRFCMMPQASGDDDDAEN